MHPEQPFERTVAPHGTNAPILTSEVVDETMRGARVSTRGVGTKRALWGIAGLSLAVVVGVWLLWRPDEPVVSSTLRSADPLPVAREAVEFDRDEPSRPIPSPKPPRGGSVDRSPAKGCALTRGEDPECFFLEPDDETMREMARCGIARFDMPVLVRSGPNARYLPDDWMEKAGVDATERAGLERAASAFATKQRDRWSALAAEVGIDRAWAEASTPSVVFLRIAAEFDQDQIATAVEGIARERAGLERTHEELPGALEAAVRLRADTGDAFEDALAEVVGPARAAELRAAGDGWPGGRGWMGNRCESERPAPTPDRVVPSTRAEAQACVDDPDGGGCRFSAPNQLELDRLADCGMVRIELPAFIGDRTSEPTFDAARSWDDDVELTPSEAAVLAQVGERIRNELYRDLTALALEAGKSQEWADQTPFIGMLVAMNEASAPTPAETEAMLRTLAAERAGRQMPPDDLAERSLEERFMRRILEVGDDLEDALAERLGPDRATALRQAHDGWPGIRNQTENYCTGAEPVFF